MKQNQKTNRANKPVEEKYLVPEKHLNQLQMVLMMKWDAYKGSWKLSWLQSTFTRCKISSKDKYSVEISTVAKSNHFIKTITAEVTKQKVLSGTAKEGVFKVFKLIQLVITFAKSILMLLDEHVRWLTCNRNSGLKLPAVEEAVETPEPVMKHCQYMYTKMAHKNYQLCMVVI